MSVKNLSKIVRASMIPAVLLSSGLMLSGCGPEQAAPVGKPGGAPETPSKPNSNYMEEMKKSSATPAPAK